MADAPEPQGAGDAWWEPPRRFDEYRLIRLLGSGGMGAVYLAEDTLLQRQVAIKFITRAADPTARERFLREARAAARLRHPNVVTVHRVGQLGDRPYIVSEFIRGTSLDSIPRPVPWQRVVEIGLGLARGLAAAHREGILHRDIKPANAMFTEEDEPVLVDFGLAKAWTAARAESSVVTMEVATPLSGPPGEEKGREGLTEVGKVIGTPLYLAPEAWMGYPATPRSDVYSFGVLLFALLTGKPPHHAVPSAALPYTVIQQDAPPVSSEVAEVEPRLAAIVDRCLQRDPSRRYSSAEALRDALAELSARQEKPVVVPGNPYRGLLPFEAEHRALFFGRASEVRRVSERLRSEGFVLVAGESGVGKSSLCRAGVLPLLAEEKSEGRSWTAVRMLPGRRPLAALAAALASPAHASEDDLVAQMVADPSALGRRLRQAAGPGSGLLLFVDQLEELLTLAQPEEAGAVARVLAGLADQPAGLRLLATVRGDFLTRLAALPELGTMIGRAVYILPPLAKDAFREIVVGPARATGVQFESEELVETLVRSATISEGSLPLLEFTLAELWERHDRAGRVIRGSALAIIGGVEGSLARHADSVIGGLLPGQRAAARRILLRLVTPAGTRAAQRVEDLTQGHADSIAALEALTRGRLVTTREDESGALYEVAHEALLAGWGTLQRWREDEAQLRPIRDRLALAAAEWKRLDRRPELLWRGEQLAEARLLDPSSRLPLEEEFLGASRAALRRARLQRWAVIGSLPLAVLLVYTAVRVVSRVDLARRISTQVTAGDSSLGAARAKRRLWEATQAESFRLFDDMKTDDAEARWAEARTRATEVETIYESAARAYEQALLEDPSRLETRRRLAQALFEEITLAGAEDQTGRVGELTSRLEVYDAGELAAQLATPARVEVTTRPVGAAVSLERFLERPDGTRPPQLLGDKGASPVSLSLGPGSYRLRFRLPGRADAVLPLRITSGELLKLDLDLPPAESVPEGFLYVPAGRFLFGSGGDEALRRFYDTVPLHPRTTAGYLIARHEITYREWIDFLAQLPTAGRSARLPRTESPGVGGEEASMSLELPTGGEPSLLIRRGGHLTRLTSRERLTYPGRETAKEADWLQLPVTGIRWEDLLAYAQWLDRSGRLVGARPCGEDEWERAARGADARLFPHGDTLRPADADFDQSHGRTPAELGPDEVGSHPLSDSPFGAEDMAGNVAEMTRSVRNPGEVVIRGGSYRDDFRRVAASNREAVNGADRRATVGGRVCAPLLE